MCGFASGERGLSILGWNYVDEGPVSDYNGGIG